MTNPERKAHIMKFVRKLVLALGNPMPLFYLLPWLMALLVLGTVAQRYIGLYAAQRLFFGSFILWAGIIPLPGAYLVLSFIAVSVSVNLLQSLRLQKQKLGIVVTHLSILLLLLGGLLAAIYTQEGYIVLDTGQTSAQVQDYYRRQLTITKNGQPMAVMPSTTLHSSALFRPSGMPFSLEVLRYCNHCIVRAEIQNGPARHGLARHFTIEQAIDPVKEEESQSGALVQVKGVSVIADGIYLASQALAEQPSFRIGNDRYEMRLESETRPLPFAIQLRHFEKSDYPGTDMARAYQSDVWVKDGALSWPVTIAMNEPLRYRGYTFYQSSYIEQDGKLLTVLAVVKNAGRWFPYIAITMLCAGLLLHLVLRIRKPVDA